MKMNFKKLKILNNSRAKTAENLRPQSAVILHADIVGSTELVRQDMMLAHQQIQYLYSRLEQITKKYTGTIYELRGDAAVIGFRNAENAVSAALLLQQTNTLLNTTRIGLLEPQIRVGISRGQVVVANNTVTGESVIVAQRLEQLAHPGEVLVDEIIEQDLKDHPDFEFEQRAFQVLKGFSKSMKIFKIEQFSTNTMHNCSAHFLAFSNQSSY